MKIKIIGAGLFGCCIAHELFKSGHDVTLIEQDSDIMQRASKCNHNRIHFGYHYPRSTTTAKQSLNGLISFLINFRESIVSHFPNYYMVAKNGSNVTSKEYIEFCENVGISYDIKFPSDKIINKNLIDLSIRVNEPVFDYNILKSLVKKQLEGVNLKLNTSFDGNLNDCDYIINTSYANINNVNKLIKAPELNLKFQDVVVPIFKMNYPPIGITIMDGPFCSIMPKGNNDNTFLLYNPKYSVLKESLINNFENLDFDENNIYNKSQEYLPFLSKVKPCGYWRTIRALPINNDDARVSEIITPNSCPKLINVISGKVTTCYKIAIEIKNLIENNSKKEIII